MTNQLFVGIFDSIPTWVMILPIILCSVLLLAVFIERMIFYKKINIDYRLLMASITEKIRQKKIYDAQSLCGRNDGPICSMIFLFLQRWDEDEDKEIVLRDLSEKSIRSIEKFGGLVSTIATVAPMLGLLGTVTGMMKSFSSLSKFGPSARDLLAQGITEALVTTALGLLVAIPAVIFYNYMVSQVERFVREVEYISNIMNDQSR
ncbi:MAG TPA: MotA/TolQ/ExbB proton channel family protein [Spirochaetota bacterium]|mgnify:CR=1 FL=1|nr:MotA/TolQ/ExbB proton channel family protein [Spirochaetota bacterium]HPI88153.1 MotA/TolQ/ExbB proton channel family protein [Spirochaetota bacterium]HPR47928.1 MotA/TolQ/ExbB proton channel family protein [Spirochaetota bacterium]